MSNAPQLLHYTNNEMETPLFAAISNGSLLQIMLEELAKQSNSNLQAYMKMVCHCDMHGYTIIHKCAQYGYVEALVAILSSAAYFSTNRFETSMHKTRLESNLKLLMNQPALSHPNWTPLHVAIKGNNYHCVKFLLSCAETSVETIDAKKRTPLVLATQLKIKEIAELLKQRVHCDAQQQDISVSPRFVELVKGLVAKFSHWPFFVQRGESAQTWPFNSRANKKKIIKH